MNKNQFRIFYFWNMKLSFSEIILFHEDLVLRQYLTQNHESLKQKCGTWQTCVSWNLYCSCIKSARLSKILSKLDHFQICNIATDQGKNNIATSRATSRAFLGTLFFEMAILPWRHNGCLQVTNFRVSDPLKMYSEESDTWDLLSYISE